MKITYIFYFAIFSYFTQVAATDFKVAGKVRHANNYREVSGVNVYVENSSQGTITNSEGFFELSLDSLSLSKHIIFEHVAFDTMHISADIAYKTDIFYLLPRVIQTPEITVEALRNNQDILHDLPQPFSVITSKRFDVQGYVDAGDLLRTEQSIQIEEELSGKKTIALRAGNPEDVVILYNGIKMNNAYDNIFDLALINLNDVKHFEIIKGSHTSIYGPEAFSGVINVVPKMHRNYTARFTQKIGTYASGDWNLQLNHNFQNRLNMSYSYKQGSAKRFYDESSEQNHLLNKISNHSANIVYDFSNPDDTNEQNLSAVFVRSTSDYENTQFDENLSTLNQMASLRYVGDIGIFKNLDLVSAYQWLDNKQTAQPDEGYLDRSFLNETFNFNAQKRIYFNRLDLLFGYQYENGTLLYNDDHNFSSQLVGGIKSGDFFRQRHGLVSIIKFHLLPESKFINLADLDLSYRYDAIANEQNNVVTKSSNDPFYNPDHFDGTDWSASTLRFSTHIKGQTPLFLLNGYINYGNNVKFPSLYQQISVPGTRDRRAAKEKEALKPEKNNSLEVGLHLLKENLELMAVDGWQLNLNYFQNYYDNKFRSYYLQGVPIAFYENVQNASISGIESKIKLFMAKSKVMFELGYSRYYVSEKAAFPFKSDSKVVANLLVEHSGYSLQVHAFKESDQLGWIADIFGQQYEITLPGYTNLDVHLSKVFEIDPIKLLLNFSGRNLFDTKTNLDGLALRDRRFYLTFGIQY